MTLQRRRIAVSGVLIVLAGSLLLAYLRLRSRVEDALQPSTSTVRPLEFVVVASPPPLEAWGGGEVEAVALTPAGLLTAGGSGVEDRPGARAPLPTLHASALTLWRGRPVAALTAGGVYLRRETGWEELRTGWGTLHVRDLRETAAGELLLGAREGLFRAAWGASTLARLHDRPVRMVVVDGDARVLTAGEEGLLAFEPGRLSRLDTPDPWVESVGRVGSRLFAVTAAGLAAGEGDGPLAAVPQGSDVTSGCSDGEHFYGVVAGEPAVLRVEAAGRVIEERLPSPASRVLCTADGVFADAEAGLHRRTRDGWVLVRPRGAALPPGPSHITALAGLGSRVVAGLFDGGLVTATVEPGSHDLAWSAVPGSSAWGVNALLPAGGALYVASLRGAARYDGTRLRPLEGPGAAFSLASTPDGVAVGYGQGVLLPGPRLLSAFHGLPGNQALALLSGDALLVGTPSGLGAVAGARVRWRVGTGDGRLPHPWVTALLRRQDVLYVGTYGGGVVRRTARDDAEPGRFEPFAETEGIKVNTGGLAEAGGRLYLATDGRGLWRLSRDGARFERLDLPLPSPRITALLPGTDALWVGTDEGLARLPLERADAAETSSR